MDGGEPCVRRLQREGDLAGEGEPRFMDRTSQVGRHPVVDGVRVGIGGWTFEPWRGVFYPEKLTQAKELSYAASKLTSIEINGTYYGSQKPESFRKWAREVPDGFVFSLKGPRFATNRRVLAEAGDSVKRFYDSGVLELGDRLGPVSGSTRSADEIARLDDAAGEFTVHVVEVCRTCRWNHLVQSYVLGADDVSGTGRRRRRTASP